MGHKVLNRTETGCSLLVSMKRTPGGGIVTLAADHDSALFHDPTERRGLAREPRRSWASSQPFEVRRTISKADDDHATGWRVVSARYGLVAAASDVTIVILVTGLTLTRSYPLLTSLVLGVLGAVVFVALVAAFGGYRSRHIGDGPAEFQSLLRAAIAMALGLMILGYVLQVPVPRSLVLVALPVGTVLCWLFRHMQRRWLHRWRQSGGAMMGTVVVGDETSAGRVIRDLALAPHHGYRVDGVCVPSLDGPRSVGGVPVLGAVADVVQIVADRQLDVVVVTGSYLSGGALRRLSWALERAGAHLVVAPDLVEVSAPRLTVHPTAGLSLLEVEVGSPRRRLVAKSIIDMTLAVFALLFFAPVIAASAIAVRATSPGPAFYRQTRVGIDGRPFTMLKLRTMYVDAEERRAALLESRMGDGVLFKMAEDPRVTRVGRVLRRYSMDELPQLLNILRGDMALVGPRPPLLEEVEAYEDQVQRRLHVRPGLTGLWQVSGRSNLGWMESVQLDLRYVDNWSVTMDLLILWKTARAVLTGNGAY